MSSEVTGEFLGTAWVMHGRCRESVNLYASDESNKFKVITAYSKQGVLLGKMELLWARKSGPRNVLFCEEHLEGIPSQSGFLGYGPGSSEGEGVSKVIVHLIDSFQNSFHNNSYRGVGSCLMDIAALCSFHLGSQGRVILNASGNPFRFYLKWGARTQEGEVADGKLWRDAASPAGRVLGSHVMYLPPSQLPYIKERIYATLSLSPSSLNLHQAAPKLPSFPQLRTRGQLLESAIYSSYIPDSQTARLVCAYALEPWEHDAIGEADLRGDQGKVVLCAADAPHRYKVISVYTQRGEKQGEAGLLWMRRGPSGKMHSEDHDEIANSCYLGYGGEMPPDGMSKIFVRTMNANENLEVARALMLTAFTYSRILGCEGRVMMDAHGNSCGRLLCLGMGTTGGKVKHWMRLANEQNMTVQQALNMQGDQTLLNLTPDQELLEMTEKSPNHDFGTQEMHLPLNQIAVWRELSQKTIRLFDTEQA